jgi:hypothetical protein
LLAEYPQIPLPTSFRERAVTATNQPNPHHSDEHTALLCSHLLAYDRDGLLVTRGND